MAKGNKAVDPSIVVAYTRVSTAEQAASGAGLDAQQTSIEAEIARRGWTLLETYTDAGLSGKSITIRPALAAALAAVESGQAGTWWLPNSTGCPAACSTLLNRWPQHSFRDGISSHSTSGSTSALQPGSS